MTFIDVALETREKIPGCSSISSASDSEPCPRPSTQHIAHVYGGHTTSLAEQFAVRPFEQMGYRHTDVLSL